MRQRVMEAPARRDYRRRAPRADGPAAARPRRVKRSVGIVICRRTAAGVPQVLSVLRRYTYAFADFIHGHYPPGAAAAALAPLFGAMTTNELIDLYSLNFEQMWYRVWVLEPRTEFFHKNQAQFAATFMARDGGAGLRRVLARVRPVGELWWELPKGRHASARESDVNCAIRETEEETGVAHGEYQILPEVRLRTAHTHNEVAYETVYLVAVARPRLAARQAPPPVALRNAKQIEEIADVRWVDAPALRDSARALAVATGAGAERLADVVARAFAAIRAHERGKRAGAPPLAPGQLRRRRRKARAKAAAPAIAPAGKS